MLDGGDEWVGSHVRVAGPCEIVHERPWATVARVPLPRGGVAWFKSCAPMQRFEARLTTQLAARWPGRVPDVLAHDEARGWLLLADAGTPMSEMGNPPEEWLAVLPEYAELQRGEVTHAGEHLEHGVPDLRVAALTDRYDDLLQPGSGLTDQERRAFERIRDRFLVLCDELAVHGVPDTMQHDDLHAWNVYCRGGRRRVLDWGDASIGHPFASLVVTFRFLEELNGLAPGDPWFTRLRDAYLEPWGRDLGATCDLAMRVGGVARTLATLGCRTIVPDDARPDFDVDLHTVARRALASIDG
jgi:hypothetical protein